MVAASARADLYQAAEAVQKQDLPRAFQLYHELAQLGHVLSQEIVAGMYVNGEGTKRDNVLGYGWAKLALEAGSASETAKSIVQQIEPHLTDAARARIEDLRAKFGSETLRASLLPEIPPLVEKKKPDETAKKKKSKKAAKAADADAAPKARCTMRAPADPSLYYPPDLRVKGIQGVALVQARVLPDGSARNPEVWYSFPVDAFDQSARAVALHSHYSSTAAEGEPPCRMLIKVRYSTPTVKNEPIKEGPKLRALAETGDPRSQVAYGILISTFSGVGRDDDRPVDWFVKASQAGIPVGQYLLARQLESGSGVKQDLAKARRWYEMAARSGSLSAIVALAQFEFRQEGDPDARARGVNLLRRAAASKDWLAQFYLAALQASDTGAPWYDPANALRTMDEIKAMFDYDPAASEIRAAAYAATGDFERARNAQRRAIRQAHANRWDDATMRSRLETYEAGKVWSGDLIAF